MTYPTPYKLLSFLNNHQWKSGPSLAKSLNISRAAIWKQVKQLKREGVAIEQSHRGYRLKAPLVLLDKNTIYAGIDDRFQQQSIQLHLLPTIDSTNTFLKQNVKDNSNSLCLSEQQTAGRGRLGRTWASPFGENMYLSVAWRTTESLAKLSGLSIAASLALKSALMPWIGDIQVKWPNDLLWHGKKIAGTLVEVTAESHGSCLIIVGMGLNINTQTNIHPLTNLPHCSMRDILGCYLDRNDIVIATINHCLHTFSQFEQLGLLPLLEAWKRADYLYDQEVTIYQHQQTEHGVAKGINSLGHLLVESDNGDIKEISSGEASLSQPI